LEVNERLLVQVSLPAGFVERIGFMIAVALKYLSEAVNYDKIFP
jgi:hypothetical protein